MKKVFLSMLIIMFILTGCNNKEEKEKAEYLQMKSNLLEHKKFSNAEDINCDIIVKIDRSNEEKIVYNVILSNPKEDMKNIKAIVVHNYYTEDIFPTIGLFNKTSELLKKDSDKTIKLKGTIDTTDDIDKLDLQLKILIKYANESGQEKDIYYKTT
jgi:hypothetical protein